MSRTVEIVMQPGHGPNITFPNIIHFSFADDKNNWIYISFQDKGYVYFSLENVMYVKVKEDV